MELEIYPKIVILLETTRSEDVIRAALDDFYGAAKTKIRSLVASDPQTSIISWHFHLSTGSVEELEP